jgi:N-acetylmuramoyl-L-alanine amidase
MARLGLAVVVTAVALVAGCETQASKGPPVDAHALATPAWLATPPVPASPLAPVTAAPSPDQGGGPAHRLPLAGKLIVIDPGHNGGNAAHPEIVNQLVDAYTQLKPCNTTGAQTDDGYAEHAFNWDVGLRLAALLRASGATVVMTRTSDTGVGPCITERAAIANRNRAAAAISIHADGAPTGGHGFHVLEPERIPGAPSTAIIEPSSRLAVAVRDRLRGVQPPATYIGQDGIDERADMAGLNLSRVPVVMVECGNMRNAVDAEKLKDAGFRQRLAAALAAAVGSFVTG